MRSPAAGSTIIHVPPDSNDDSTCVAAATGSLMSRSESKVATRSKP